MAKKELSISEFREIIREEALKLKKRIVLENEKKALQSELNSLMNESFGENAYEENSVEEILGFGKKSGEKAPGLEYQRAQAFLATAEGANFRKAYENYKAARDAKNPQASQRLLGLNKFLMNVAEKQYELFGGSRQVFMKDVYAVIDGKTDTSFRSGAAQAGE